MGHRPPKSESPSPRQPLLCRLGLHSYRTRHGAAPECYRSGCPLNRPRPLPSRPYPGSGVSLEQHGLLIAETALLADQIDYDQHERSVEHVLNGGELHPVKGVPRAQPRRKRRAGFTSPYEYRATVSLPPPNPTSALGRPETRGRRGP